MSYYHALSLAKEPFSTSPDPLFFYKSSEHNTALQRLEITVRLRRGLSLILGDVGTGKTTLSRALVQNFTGDDNYVFHMILDPLYKSEFQFLSSLGRIFGVEPDFRSTLDYRDAIKKYLFEKSVNEQKIIVLVIDEGQKLTQSSMEILRTLLNYETNEFKMLQLIILAQMELLPKVKRIKNFLDRVSLKYIINPLDERGTRELIDFRLVQAGFNSGGRRLFDDSAVRLIYDYSLGYPRKISMLCHNALETLVMEKKPVVDENVMREVIMQEGVI